MRKFEARGHGDSCVFVELSKDDKHQRPLGIAGIAHADITHGKAQQRLDLLERVKEKLSCGNAWRESRISGTIRAGSGWRRFGKII